jgi:hypothetical protein
MPIEQLTLSFPDSSINNPNSFDHLRKTLRNGAPKISEWEQDLMDYDAKMSAIATTGLEPQMVEWLLRQGASYSGKGDYTDSLRSFPPLGSNEQGRRIARRKEVARIGLAACRETLGSSNVRRSADNSAA